MHLVFSVQHNIGSRCQRTGTALECSYLLKNSFKVLETMKTSVCVAVRPCLVYPLDAAIRTQRRTGKQIPDNDYFILFYFIGTNKFKGLF